MPSEKAHATSDLPAIVKSQRDFFRWLQAPWTPAGSPPRLVDWFYPCYYPVYDISGRVRHGPAPKNLRLPSFGSDKYAPTTVTGSSTPTAIFRSSQR
jgi:hypothetical protein